MSQENGASDSDTEPRNTDVEFGKILADIIDDNIKLRRRVNSVLHRLRRRDVNKRDVTNNGAEEGPS